MTETLHFKVHGRGITELVRGIYLYEDKDKAWNIIGTMSGITVEQCKSVFIGDAEFENDKKDDTVVNLIFKEDKKWKEEVAKQVIFLTEKEKQEREDIKNQGYALELTSKYDYMDIEEAKCWIQQARGKKYSTRPIVSIAIDLITQSKMVEIKEGIDNDNDDVLEKLQKDANLKIAKALFIQNFDEKDPISKKATDSMIKSFASKKYTFDFKGHHYDFNDSARNQGECPHCSTKAPDGDFWRNTDEGYLGYYDFDNVHLGICFECPNCFEKFYYHHDKDDFLRNLESS